MHAGDYTKDFIATVHKGKWEYFTDNLFSSFDLSLQQSDACVFYGFSLAQCVKIDISS